MSRRSARRLVATTIAFSLLLLNGTQARSDDTIETLVLVRHGEKPDTGLGQLDCQGLNRALALPHVIAKTFGRPSAVFAPDPSRQMQDHGVAYDYVRPPRDDRADCDILRSADQCELRLLRHRWATSRRRTADLSQCACPDRLGAQAYRNYSPETSLRSRRRCVRCAEMATR